MRTSKKVIVGALIAAVLGSSVPLAQAGDYVRYERVEHYDRDHDHSHDHRQYDEWRGRRADWDRIGTVKAERELDGDRIELGKNARRYEALMFRVDRGDIVVEDLKIIFADDSIYSPDLKLVFREGERSCAIDLPPNAGRVKRIRFLYRSVGHKHNALVDVYGLR
jgi:hypothetical protein